MTFPEDPINTHQMGQQITLYADFVDVDGDADDPDVVLLKYIEGDDDGTEVDVLQPSLSNPSVGRWEYNLLLPLDGDKAVRPWVYRFEATSVAVDGVNTAAEHRFEVATSPFYPET